MKRAYYSKKFGFATFCIFIIFFAVSCAARYNRYGLPQYEYKTPDKIDDGWQTSSLDAEDVDPGKINEMIGKILDGEIDNIHGIVVIKNGKLVLEEYFDGFDQETKHRIFSASKSVTSILIGMAIDRGMIKDVDTRIYEFFPEFEGTKWKYRNQWTTYRDILCGRTWRTVYFRNPFIGLCDCYHQQMDRKFLR